MHFKLGRGAALATALAVCGVCSRAEQLPLKVYTVADGLAHNRVKRIVSDRHNFLWFCTSDGLSRFDGSRFANFSNGQGLASASANDLLENPDGSYWIATNGGGVVRFRGNGPLRPATEATKRARFETHLLTSQGPANRVNVLYRGRSGTVWLGSDGGLFRMQDHGQNVSIQRVPLNLPSHPDPGVQVWAILEDSDRHLWVGTRFGLVRIVPDGHVIHYEVRTGAGSDAVNSLLLDSKGRLWIGHAAGVLVYAPGPWSGTPTAAVTEDPALRIAFERDHRAHAPAAIPSLGQARFYSTGGESGKHGVYGIHEFADGRIWVATVGAGLLEFSGRRFDSVATGRLDAFVVADIAEDHDHNVWLATSNNGAVKVTRKGFWAYGESDRLGSLVQGVFEGDGGLLVTSGVGLISRFDGRGFATTRVNVPGESLGSSWSNPDTVIQDHLGEWWMGTRAGLYRFAKTERLEQLASARPKAVYRRIDGLADDHITRLFEDSRGDIWISAFIPSRVAIVRWERRTGKFHGYSDVDGLPAFNAPAAVIEDRAGAVWIGFREGGLARYSSGRFHLFTTSEGAPQSEIRALHTDRDGGLWCATQREGLIHFDPPRPTQLLPTSNNGRAGLGGELVTALAEDAQGRVLAGTFRGLYRIDPGMHHVRRYSANDGLGSGEVMKIFLDRRGTIWCATLSGLYRLDSSEDDRAAAPPALISDLRISGAEQIVPAIGARELSLPDLPSDRRSIELEYLAVSFAAAETLRFQYRLDGADLDWSEPNAMRSVHFPNLPAGRYRFTVRTVGFDGAPGADPAQLSFRILPPFWRTWWFISLAIAALAAALIAFDRFRVARLKELGLALDQLTGQRTALRAANAALDLEFSVTRALAHSEDPAAAASEILEAICRRTAWGAGAIWEADPNTGLLRCLDLWHLPEHAPLTIEKYTRRCSLPPGIDLPGRVAASGEMAWIADLGDNLTSAAAFPILSGGEVIGVLALYSESRLEPDDSQIQTINAIGHHISQLIQRTRADRALRESESRFRTLAETASDAILTIDSSSKILFVNPAAEEIFGYPASRMLGHDLTMLMPERMRAAHRAGFGRYLSTGQRRIAWKAMEIPGLRASGAEIALEISFGEFSRDGQRLFTGVARDIGERKRAEEALRMSREDRIAELERVRRRIATDLHDDVGSSLTQISVLSEVARRQLGDEHSAANTPLSTIAATSRELIDSMSDIVWAINPQRDSLSELTHRMRRFAADTFTARSIAFTIELPANDDDLRLEGSLRRELYLIFKESVNNVVRHSGCMQAGVAFQIEKGAVQLVVRDNGFGFDTTRENDGHGMLSMRSRAERIGGRLEISSAPGRGTSIFFTAPLNPYKSM